MNPKYPNLLSPGQIGNVTLRNKTVMAAMGMSQSDNGFVNKAVLNHYAARANGGVGAIIVEVTCVDTPLGLNTNGMLVIDDDKYIPGMTQLADVIHKGGAKAFLQISHTGRGARRKIIGEQPVGPSAVAMPYSFMMGLANETPRALTVDEIHEIEEKYAQAALRAKKAGFDGVEIHSVGYYLGQQFLSSTANTRTDEYGGSRRNRVRFHLNIITRIRELCGNDFAVIVKLSVVEQGKDGGISIPDGIYYSKQFQKAGVDAIEVLAGKWSEESGKREKPESAYPDCMAVPLCQVVKAGLLLTAGKKSVKLIGGGRAQNPEKAEKALATGKCDFIFIGHALLAEPLLVRLIDEGREDEIRPCIGCGHCINNQLQHGERAICSGNAVLARGENNYTLTPAEIKKKVVVIGGGVAGVEAARIAALRGHTVDIYEASGETGGQINLACKPPFKDHFTLLKPYLERQLELTGVNVHLGKQLTKNEVLAMNADAVVCATGSKPVMLRIEGSDRAVFAKDILAGAPAGKNVVVIGGGSTGCETAEFLGKQGKKVTVIEMSEVVAGNTGKTAQTILLGHLKGYGVKILTGCRAEKITQTEVVCKNKSGSGFSVKADTVVLSIGERPDSTLFDELKDIHPEVYNIGDSNGGEILPNAVYEGYTVGNRI
ncbi:MAG: FAD-dependent oxidoreductase [Clostridia bacterium]|nr:FAD-dependent oxidoreductase [Clostridia bacterium]MBR0122103.1 FAD-dependent oxidoreductase [Clostridia bacterium]